MVMSRAGMTRTHAESAEALFHGVGGAQAKMQAGAAASGKTLSPGSSNSNPKIKIRSSKKDVKKRNQSLQQA
ncbi:MAG: hypothetical protein K2Y29_00175 [Beijerinckiaceae bacterium]|nr:hypothetical protein [Beijerinckiaceae bacterium]